MKTNRIHLKKRLLAFLLSLLLCLCPSAPAAAEDAPSLPPEEPALTEPAPPEETGESAPQENTEVPKAADLLVTGGHSTYMNGAPGALFLPDKVMSRSEAAQMLYNLLAAKQPVSVSQFSDVSLNSWYGTAVNSLALAKVFSGYADGSFGPGDPMTRAQFVTALYMCFSLEDGDLTFPDVPSTHWASRYISAAASTGWIKGTGSGLFQPDRGITRAEAVTVMNAALGRTGEGFAADREVQKFYDVPKSHWAYLQVAEAARPVDTPPPAEEPPAEEPDPNEEFTVGQSVQVTANSGLNLRSQPSTGSSVVTVLSKGAVLTVTDVSQLPWLGVKTSTGQTGYVSSQYVAGYTPGSATGVSLSPTTLSMHQYQSARLDASIASGSFNGLSWTSSDPNVAMVGYSMRYGTSNTLGAIVYGKNPGTATLTYSDASGNSKASCTVTVTAAESVRFAYASENSAVVGVNFDLVAVTDPTRTSVTFTILSGPASGSYSINSYVTESRNSKYGMPTNTVRVFKRTVSFGAAGTYKVRATAGGSDYCDFDVFVKPSEESVTATSTAERRCSTEGLKIIANFEGSVPEVKDDALATGNPTVGYGVVIQKGEAFYNNMTDSELFAFLVKKANGSYTSAVNRFRANNNLKMSQAQFDALVSFTFNCGDCLNSGRYDMPKTILNAVELPDISESQPYPGTVNSTDTGSNNTTLYADPSKDSPSLGYVPKGSSVTIIEISTIPELKQIWYKVRYNNATGWIPAGLVQLNTSGLVHDLAYADAAGVANNIIQWHKASNTCYEGLVYRRVAECKIFFFGDYAEAYHTSSNYRKNTYGFIYPSCEKRLE